MRRTSLHRPLGAGLLLLAACDDYIACTPVLKTELGQLELQDYEVVLGACRRLREPAPLLVGTRWCPILSCDSGQPGCVIDEESGQRLEPYDVAACFDHTIEGATPDGPCLVVEAPGELRWTFTAIDCAATAASGFTPQGDSLALPVVEATEIFAHLDVPGDAFARRSLVGADNQPFPTALQLAPDAVAHVLAGHEVELAVVLTHPDLGDVGWNPPAFTLHATVDDAERAVELEPTGLVSVTLAAGEHMVLWLERGDETLALGEVEGVAAEELTAIEVIAGFTGNEDDPGIPFGARAVAWAGDRIVYGVPVDWTVTEGLLPLWRDPERPWGPDYVALVDEDGLRCHSPPKKERRDYRARLRASYGALENETTLLWSEEPEEEGSVEQEILSGLEGEGTERSPLCEGPGFASAGCGCRSGSDGRLGALVLLVLGLGSRTRTGRTPSLERWPKRRTG
jgi:MYXO-CTERM domain-containing protein